MAAKFFTGLPLDGPDPECVKGHGEEALARTVPPPAPRPSGDHSHRTVRSNRPGTGDHRPAALRRPAPAGLSLRREPPAPAFSPGS